MHLTGEITGVLKDGSILIKTEPPEQDWIVEKQKIVKVEVYLPDGRLITPKQRKFIFALISDIAAHEGYGDPKTSKGVNRRDIEMFQVDLMLDYISHSGSEYFSLSHKKENAATVTQANEFLSFLIWHCLEFDVPTKRPLHEYAPHTENYVYACLMNKKCCACNKPVEMVDEQGGVAYKGIHHWDRIGRGRNRDEINHNGVRIQPLCGTCHTYCHTVSQAEFDYLYHVCPIVCNAEIAKIYKLPYWEE